jgi:hypothetical protein
MLSSSNSKPTSGSSRCARKTNDQFIMLDVSVKKVHIVPASSVHLDSTDAA